MKQNETSLQQIIGRHKNGYPVGVFSVCSANPIVIDTSIKFAAKQDIPILIEATCNQVNQFGGYTGMLPQQFADYVWQLVEKYGLSKQNITLGGDHLGPYPWQNEPADVAMEKACQMVDDYVRAGYTKLHLDASMKCANDDPGIPLDIKISASRAAMLGEVAEKAAMIAHTTEEIVYVIGTEVPLPGGSEADEGKLQVTLVENVIETIDITKKAFFSHGLEQAWHRVLAVVVQPGVEFGNNRVFHYQRGSSRQLTEFIAENEQLIFEAHSTDFQTEEALKELVEDHFSILKVGPELTFAYREAIFALEFIERELFGKRDDVIFSDIKKTVDAVMLESPAHWKKYYLGTPEEQAYSRSYSFSDRIRYYWPNPKIQIGIQRLYANLNGRKIPLPLAHQFFPQQYHLFQKDESLITADSLVEGKINHILAKYTNACHID